MSEMIKRVSKAICCPSGVCENGNKKYDPTRGKVSICMAHTFEKEACAAIEAMREPTSAMIVEAMVTAYPTLAEAGGILEQGRLAARLEWQAMIDAALSSQERT